MVAADNNGRTGKRAMCDDFCMIHGYQGMRKRDVSDKFAYCRHCEQESEAMTAKPQTERTWITGAKRMRFVIKHEGSGGELDRRETDSEELIGEAVAQIATANVFAPGDIIRIIDTQQED